MELIDIITFCIRHDCTICISNGTVTARKVVNNSAAITSSGDKETDITTENFQYRIRALLERFELRIKQTS